MEVQPPTSSSHSQATDLKSADNFDAMTFAINRMSSFDQTCSCCPYGYHIDLDFLRYLDSLYSSETLKRLKKSRLGKYASLPRSLEHPQHAPQVYSAPDTNTSTVSENMGVSTTSRRTGKEVTVELDISQITESSRNLLCSPGSPINAGTSIFSENPGVSAKSRRTGKEVTVELDISQITESSGNLLSSPTFPTNAGTSIISENPGVSAKSRRTGKEVTVELDISKSMESSRNLQSLPVSPNSDSKFRSETELFISSSSERRRQSSIRTTLERFEAASQLSAKTETYSDIPERPSPAARADDLPFAMPYRAFSRGSSSSPVESDASSGGGGISPAVLQAIREQMAQSLRRMKELEEQVKVIPALKARVATLTKENRDLARTIQAGGESSGVAGRRLVHRWTQTEWLSEGTQDAVGSSREVDVGGMRVSEVGTEVVRTVGASPVGFTSIGTTSIGVTSFGATSVGVTSVGATSVGASPVGVTSIGTSPVGGFPVGVSTGVGPYRTTSQEARYYSVAIQCRLLSDGENLEGGVIKEEMTSVAVDVRPNVISRCVGTDDGFLWYPPESGSGDSQRLARWMELSVESAVKVDGSPDPGQGQLTSEGVPCDGARTLRTPTDESKVLGKDFSTKRGLEEVDSGEESVEEEVFEFSDRSFEFEAAVVDAELSSDDIGREPSSVKAVGADSADEDVVVEKAVGGYDGLALEREVGFARESDDASLEMEGVWLGGDLDKPETGESLQGVDRSRHFAAEGVCLDAGSKAETKHEGISGDGNDGEAKIEDISVDGKSSETINEESSVAEKLTDAQDGAISDPGKTAEMVDEDIQDSDREAETRSVDISDADNKSVTDDGQSVEVHAAAESKREERFGEDVETKHEHEDQPSNGDVGVSDQRTEFETEFLLVGDQIVKSAKLESRRGTMSLETNLEVLFEHEVEREEEQEISVEMNLGNEVNEAERSGVDVDLLNVDAVGVVAVSEENMNIERKVGIGDESELAGYEAGGISDKSKEAEYEDGKGIVDAKNEDISETGRVAENEEMSLPNEDARKRSTELVDLQAELKTEGGGVLCEEHEVGIKSEDAGKEDAAQSKETNYSEDKRSVNKEAEEVLHGGRCLDEGAIERFNDSEKEDDEEIADTESDMTRSDEESCGSYEVDCVTRGESRAILEEEEEETMAAVETWQTIRGTGMVTVETGREIGSISVATMEAGKEGGDTSIATIETEQEGASTGEVTAEIGNEDVSTGIVAVEIIWKEEASTSKATIETGKESASNDMTTRSELECLDEIREEGVATETVSADNESETLTSVGKTVVAMDATGETMETEVALTAEGTRSDEVDDSGWDEDGGNRSTSLEVAANTDIERIQEEKKTLRVEELSAGVDGESQSSVVCEDRVVGEDSEENESEVLFPRENESEVRVKEELESEVRVSEVKVSKEEEAEVRDSEVAVTEEKKSEIWVSKELKSEDEESEVRVYVVEKSEAKVSREEESEFNESEVKKTEGKASVECESEVMVSIERQSEVMVSEVRATKEKEDEVRVNQETRSEVRVPEDNESEVRATEENTSVVPALGENESEVMVNEEMKSEVKESEIKISEVKVSKEEDPEYNESEVEKSEEKAYEERESEVIVSEITESEVNKSEEEAAKKNESDAVIPIEKESEIDRVSEEKKSEDKISGENECEVMVAEVVRISEETVSDVNESEVKVSIDKELGGKVSDKEEFEVKVDEEKKFEVVMAPKVNESEVMIPQETKSEVSESEEKFSVDKKSEGKVSEEEELKIPEQIESTVKGCQEEEFEVRVNKDQESEVMVLEESVVVYKEEESVVRVPGEKGSDENESEVKKSEEKKSEVRVNEELESEVKQSEIKKSEVTESEVRTTEENESEVSINEELESEVKESEVRASAVEVSIEEEFKFNESEIKKSEEEASDESESEIGTSKERRSEVMISEVTESEVRALEKREAEVSVKEELESDEKKPEEEKSEEKKPEERRSEEKDSEGWELVEKVSDVNKLIAEVSETREEPMERKEEAKTSKENETDTTVLDTKESEEWELVDKEFDQGEEVSELVSSVDRGLSQGLSQSHGSSQGSSQGLGQGLSQSEESSQGSTQSRESSQGSNTAPSIDHIEIISTSESSCHESIIVSERVLSQLEKKEHDSKSLSRDTADRLSGEPADGLVDANSELVEDLQQREVDESVVVLGDKVEETPLELRKDELEFVERVTVSREPAHSGEPNDGIVHNTSVVSEKTVASDTSLEQIKSVVPCSSEVPASSAVPPANAEPYTSVDLDQHAVASVSVDAAGKEHAEHAEAAKQFREASQTGPSVAHEDSSDFCSVESALSSTKRVVITETRIERRRADQHGSSQGSSQGLSQSQESSQGSSQESSQGASQGSSQGSTAPGSEELNRADPPEAEIKRRSDSPSASGGSQSADSSEKMAVDLVVRPDVLAACAVYAEYLRDPTVAVDSDNVVSCVDFLRNHWFDLSGRKTSDASLVRIHLEEFQTFGTCLAQSLVNMADDDGNTAMHYAVSYGNMAVIEVLLNTGFCNVSRQNRAGYTAIMLASLLLVDLDQHEVLVLRLFHEGDVNSTSSTSGQTSLMLAASHGRSEMVSLLLQTGAEINLQDEDGSTALMCASEHGHTEVIRTLLGHPECDSTITDIDGSTALSIAMEEGHHDNGVFLYAHMKAIDDRLLEED